MCLYKNFESYIRKTKEYSLVKRACYYRLIDSKGKCIGPIIKRSKKGDAISLESYINERGTIGRRTKTKKYKSKKTLFSAVDKILQVTVPEEIQNKKVGKIYVNTLEYFPIRGTYKTRMGFTTRSVKKRASEQTRTYPSAKTELELPATYGLGSENTLMKLAMTYNVDNSKPKNSVTFITPKSLEDFLLKLKDMSKKKEI